MKSYATVLVVLLVLGIAQAGLHNRRPYGLGHHHGGYVGNHHGSHGGFGGVHHVTGGFGGLGGFGGGVHGGLGGGFHGGVGGGIHGGHGGHCKYYCKNNYHNDYDCCDHLQHGHGLYH
ncbi:uncharacterized protein LOC143031109 [Oratosquilla oratoria]|uniref:uncharacterized protein LOC143031109 n=1 Tax=Oratosquilla oratoria TaxID=337810 RepID=UPI003F75D6C9